MYKTLFFIEPRIDFDMPMLRNHWLVFAAELARALHPDVGTWPEQVRTVSNAHIRPTALQQGFPESCTLICEPRDILRAFDGIPSSAREAWYLNGYSKDQLAITAATVRDIAQGFCPDIVVTFTPSPYLQEAFPDAVIYHHEVGIFSRSPFPITKRLDPFGLLEGSYAHAFAAELRSLEPSAEATAFVERLREEFVPVCRDSNPVPLGDIVRKTGKFKAVWMLPLGFDRIFQEYHKAAMTQFEFIIHILDRMPSTHALLVTEHPDVGVLGGEQVAYLERAYPNFLMFEEFSSWYASSIFLMPFVSGVIAVWSSLGMQSALWRKKLIQPFGATHLVPFADASNFDDMDAVFLEDRQGNKDAILHWLLTRYFIPGTYLDDPSFCRKFFSNVGRKWRNRERNFEMYERIDTDEKILDALISGKNTKNFPKKAELDLGGFSISQRSYIKYLQERHQESARILEALLARVRASTIQGQ